MALLNVVTALTQEIQYVDEMVRNLAKRSEDRQIELRKHFDAAMEEERRTTTAIIGELSELKHKLAGLIEEPKNE